jgi:hypothetical protein
MVRTVQSRSNQVVETSVSAIKDLLRGLLSCSKSAQQNTTIANQKSPRLNPYLNFPSRFLLISFTQLPDPPIKPLNINNLFLRPVLYPHSSTDVNVFKLCKFLAQFINVPDSVNENVLVFGLEIWANMLMQANDVNLVLFSQGYELINVSVINAELAFRATGNDLISFARPKIGIKPNKNLFVSEFVLKPLQSFQRPNIQHNTFFQRIVQFLFTYKIFRIQNLIRLVATLERLENFTWRHYVNIWNTALLQQAQ